MLYEIAHILRDKLPFIWDLIDLLNSWLFGMRFSGKRRAIEADVIKKYEAEVSMRIVQMNKVETEKLVAFFAAQPEEAFTFFKPHGFDAKSIKKLQRNKAFLGYVLLDGDSIAGYCFNRSFFHGKGFRGRMVGMDYRGRGLGTLMNKLLNEVGFGIGLRLFETVSKDNIASYRSAISASNFKVLEELPHNELYLEIIKD